MNDVRGFEDGCGNIIENWDTTLREGEQQLGVCFSFEEKMEIINLLLEKYRVANLVEFHCYVHTLDQAKKVVRMFGKERILLHHRLCKEDVENSRKIGRDVKIAMFIGVSESHLKSLGISKQEVLHRLREVIQYAESFNLKIWKIALEDALNADINFVREIVYLLDKMQCVFSISPAVTVDRFGPERYGKFIRKIRKITDIPIVVHYHNDLGLALQGCWEAYKAGARIFNTSILGLGERAGITPFEHWAVFFRLKGFKINTSCIAEICDKVSRYTGIKPMPHYPIIGANIFTHKAGVHARKVIYNPEAYEPFPPEFVGRKSRKIVLSHLTGKSNVILKLREEYDMDVNSISEEKIKEIAKKVREYCIKHGEDCPDDIFEKILADVLEVSLNDIIKLKKQKEFDENFILRNLGTKKIRYNQGLYS